LLHLLTTASGTSPTQPHAALCPQLVEADIADAVQQTNDLDVKVIVNLWAGSSASSKVNAGRQLG
jgi:hypothetical protein